MAKASSPQTSSAAQRSTNTAGAVTGRPAAASAYDALRLDLIDLDQHPEATAALAFAKCVVDDLLVDLQAAARENVAYAAPVLMMSFDKATFGDEPVTGETHFSAIAMPGLTQVLSFTNDITAADAVLLFSEGEDDVRVALMVMLLELARLHGKERSRKDDRALAESATHLQAVLRYAMTAL